MIPNKILNPENPSIKLGSLHISEQKSDEKIKNFYIQLGLYCKSKGYKDFHVPNFTCDNFEVFS